MDRISLPAQGRMDIDYVLLAEMQELCLKIFSFLWSILISIKALSAATATIAINNHI